MALVIGAVGFWVNQSDDEDADRSPSEPTDDDADESADSTAPTTEPSEPIAEDEFIALVRDLQDYVETARNLTFSRDVVVELEDDEDFEQRLLEDFEEDIGEFEEAEVFYRALGLLDSDEPLVEQLRAIYAQGVLGFYDTETDELVVRGRSATPYVQQTIVHELVHAIDDQNFELYRPEYDDLDTEVPTGFSAVVEGNARRVENDWMDEQTEEFQDQAAAEEEAFGETLDLDGFPYVLLFEIAAPYQFGEQFVATIVGRQGERAVDQALATPPETSEQILFAETYDSREPRVEVPAPPADGEVLDEGAFGSLRLFGLLTDPDSGIDPGSASAAVDGWGGDWYVTWTDDDVRCMRADFVGDSTQDTTEIRSALDQWVGERGVGEVSDVDGRVRLESCL